MPSRGRCIVPAAVRYYAHDSNVVTTNETSLKCIAGDAVPVPAADA
jgi:hypothetical protein